LTVGPHWVYAANRLQQMTPLFMDCGALGADRSLARKAGDPKF
jgi:hypothetical protein